MTRFPFIHQAQIWEWSSKTALQVMTLSILDDGWHIRDDWESIYSWPAHSCALNPLKKLWSIPRKRYVRQFNSKLDLWEAAQAPDSNAYASTITYWSSDMDKRVMREPERYFHVYQSLWKFFCIFRYFVYVTSAWNVVLMIVVCIFIWRQRKLTIFSMKMVYYVWKLNLAYNLLTVAMPFFLNFIKFSMK